MNKQQWWFISITALFFCLVIAVCINRNLYNTQVEAQSATDSSQTLDFRIDLNTATAWQLEWLPGIGQVLSDRIIAYRIENGPFTDINEIMNVNGIGQKKFEDIKKFIKVGGTNENSGS